MASTYYHLVPRDNPALLSLVIPAYNEQEVLPVLRERLTPFMDALPCPCELLLVNDGSSDRTLEHLLEWARDDARVKVLSLARNFGHQVAVTAGLDAACGDAVVIMDADLQDPPEVVLEMLREYRKGYDVVYGQRISREGETWFKRFTAWGFYRMMRTLVHPGLPPDTGDFRLVSRPCLDAVKQMREVHRFLRGMVAWVGFAQTAVQFRRPARAAGVTKYPLRKMLRFAWTAALSFSPLPLRASLAGGLILAGVGLLAGVYALVVKLAGWYTAPGWTSEMLVLCLLSGAVLVSNGILGEYVGRIYEQVKDRPLYVVSLRVNTSSPPAAKAARQEDAA